MIKKIFLSFFIFILISGTLFSKEFTIYDNTVDKNFTGKVISFNNNKIKLKNTETNEILELNIDKNNMKNIDIGDTVFIKRNFHYRCKCRNIRERIKQLAEKRRKINKMHKGFSNNFMHRHGKK